MTSLSAGYRTVFRVQGCWMCEQKSCTKDWEWSKCKGHCDFCPCVFYSVLFYWFVLLSGPDVSQFSSVLNIMMSPQIYCNIIFPLDLGIRKLLRP